MRRLRDPTSWVSKIARRFARLIRARIEMAAFHPGAGQRVIERSPAVFALLRTAADGRHVLALTNVTGRPTTFSCPRTELATDAAEWRDLLSRRRVRAGVDGVATRLAPYEVLWLTPRI